MRIKTLLLIILVYSISLQAQVRTPRGIAQPPRPGAAAETGNGTVLPIRRVILYSNGVAYIERRGWFRATPR